MTRLHEGLDYLLYRIYIWSGIAALVIYLDAVTLWVLGILAYWWWVFLFKGNKDGYRRKRHPSKSTARPGNWWPTKARPKP